MQLPKRLSLAQTPTPLQLLKRVSAELGVNVWMKRDDLTGSALSGNKVRKLEFSLAEALSQGCDSIITCGGLQSNHCRATALLGAQLGLKVSLLLRGRQGSDLDGNLLLDYLAGAELSIIEPRLYASSLAKLLEDKAAHLCQQGCKPFVIPTGASDSVGIWGYIAAAQELQMDFHHHRIVPSHIVCASGSGGTQAGLTLGAHMLGWQSEVLGMAVCDDEAYFQHRVREDIQGCIERYDLSVDAQACCIRVNDRYIGPGYARADGCIFETIRWLASIEGVVLDPVYTAKAFHGLRQEILSGSLRDARDVVFVHTGGIFGLFPQREGFTSLDP